MKRRREEESTDGDHADAGDHDGRLLEAADDGNLSLVEELLGKGSNVNVKGDRGCTPLHFACWEGHLGVSKLLIESWADVLVQDEDGETALHNAGYDGHSEVVKMLLRQMVTLST